MTASECTGFWSAHQPGFRFASSPVGSPEFFREVEEHRYRLEPHIPELAHFDRWAGRKVLEVGCGIATDGVRFARAGADFTAVDQSDTALELARKRFGLEALEGRFEQASASELPFADASFDLVYSHGVIHHIPDPERALREFERVLRPGGEALVMIYHRDSLNYRVNIMLVRRTLAAAMLVPGVVPTLSRALGEEAEVLEGHRGLLRRHGARYLRDRDLFLSNNTDGPGNPLSRVYSRNEARSLFRGFAGTELAIRYLNLRLLPGGERLAGTRLARRLERRIGWHLYVRAFKGATNSAIAVRNASGE